MGLSRRDEHLPFDVQQSVQSGIRFIECVFPLCETAESFLEGSLSANFLGGHCAPKCCGNAAAGIPKLENASESSRPLAFPVAKKKKKITPLLLIYATHFGIFHIFQIADWMKPVVRCSSYRLIFLNTIPIIETRFHDLTLEIRLIADISLCLKWDALKGELLPCLDGDVYLVVRVVLSRQAVKVIIRGENRA